VSYDKPVIPPSNIWVTLVLGSVHRRVFSAVRLAPLVLATPLPLRGDSAPTWEHTVVFVGVIRREGSCLEGGVRVKDARSTIRKFSSLSR